MGVFGAVSCRTAYYRTRQAVSALLVPEEGASKKRRRRDSNPRMTVLQTVPLDRLGTPP